MIVPHYTKAVCVKLSCLTFNLSHVCQFEIDDIESIREGSIHITTIFNLIYPLAGLCFSIILYRNADDGLSVQDSYEKYWSILNSTAKVTNPLTPLNWLSRLMKEVYKLLVNVISCFDAEEEQAGYSSHDTYYYVYDLYLFHV